MQFYTGESLIEVKDYTLKTAPSAGVFMQSFASPDQIISFYEMARDGRISGKPHLIFYVRDYEKTVGAIRKYFEIIHAAGGIVEKKDKLLFIKRWGLWDLPKGKVEENEDIAEAALREVEEECGITAKLKEKIGETWHTYQRDGKEVLKCTHWYRMKCKDDSEMQPQTEEDIEQVEWMTTEKVEQTCLKETYASIRDIYEQYQKLMSERK
ncbi:NUDIX hydrolase [Sediminitomix flava]|uniref:ADP-ribose pyrophosphatase YjhB (NUDIX family) n=1 Tax=Sediminitomix flava TaxID=379075 RepID=A0A315ZFC7_SEDFL|nr:NUDIX domain-containing protein [Sediminitomix flava]PWJ44265.1 ADP-ribose pyrophosphatase YjhB (NUDIX family) [Sediminitomix flava]